MGSRRFRRRAPKVLALYDLDSVLALLSEGEMENVDSGRELAEEVAYLREAKQAGDVLVVGVNTDRQVASLKGPGRPIFNERERLEMLGELRCVDSLVLFDELTAHDLIRAVAPDVYVKGGDYEPQQIVEHDVLVELGIEIRVLAHRPGVCSTSVIERIRSES